MSGAVFSDVIEQIWNNGDASAIERFIALEFQGFDPAPITGLEGYKQHFGTLTTAFSDIRITIEDIFDEGERVAARYVVAATHTGNFGDLPPTGTRVLVPAVAIALIRNGQIVVEHAMSDTLGLLHQLGPRPESLDVPSGWLV